MGSCLVCEEWSWCLGDIIKSGMMIVIDHAAMPAETVMSSCDHHASNGCGPYKAPLR